MKRKYLLYLFGFVFNFRPADPFTYAYLVHYKNIPEQKVRQDVLPTFIYTIALQAVLVFLFSDILKYKLFVVISSLSAVAAGCVISWTYTVESMEIAQIFWGTTAATEVAYYVFIYAHNEVRDYQKLTSHIIAATLAGKAVSWTLGYFLLLFRIFNMQELRYINLTAYILAAALSVCIPAVKESNYQLPASSNRHDKLLKRIINTLLEFKSDFVKVFSKKHIIRWSIWMTCMICSYTQVTTFIQPLWDVLSKEGVMVNGGVESTSAGFSFIVVILAGTLPIDWKRSTFVIMNIVLIVQFGLLFGMYIGNTIFLCFTPYIFFSVIHYFVITAVSSEIAQIVDKGCFGMVFGFIYLVASTLDAIMVCVINDGFKLEPSQQFFMYFVVYAGIYLAILIGFIVKFIVDKVMIRHEQSRY